MIAPSAGNLIKGIAGKGLQVGRKRRGSTYTAKGLQIGPPGAKRRVAYRRKNKLVSHEIIFNNEPISNHDILKWIDKLNRKNFDGVFNKQELPKVNNSAIINLDDIDGPGTHWCCIMTTPKGESKYIYFDPFGMVPPREVLDTYSPLKYNIVQYQDNTSVLCGYFCFFLFRNIQKDIQYMISYIKNYIPLIH